MKQKIITFGAPPSSSGKIPDRHPPHRKTKKHRRGRRAGRQTLNYLLLFLTAASIMATLSLTVFFRIEKISVEGATKYAPQALLEDSGVEKGDNLFRVSGRLLEKRLKPKYPYIEQVTVHRRLPDELVIEVTQARQFASLDTAAGFVVIGENGRVLEIGTQTLDEGVLVVSGMYLFEPSVGRILGEGYDKEYAEQAALEAGDFKRLKYLVEAVEVTGFERITRVDFSDHLNMMIVYDDRLLIELGSELGVDYKLRLAKQVIETELDSTFEGTLDAASAAETKKVYTRAGDLAAELEKRQLSIQEQEREQVQAQPPDGSVAEGSEVEQNPELAVDSSKRLTSPAGASSSLEEPGGSASGNGTPSSSGSGTSGSESAQSSSATGASSETDSSSGEEQPRGKDELAVVPGVNMLPPSSEPKAEDP